MLKILHPLFKKKSYLLVFFPVIWAIIICNTFSCSLPQGLPMLHLGIVVHVFFLTLRPADNCLLALKFPQVPYEDSFRT